MSCTLCLVFTHIYVKLLDAINALPKRMFKQVSLPARFAPHGYLVKAVACSAFARQLAILSDYFLALASSLLLQTVVIARAPARVLLHVFEALLTRHLVVLGLIGALELVPLAAQYLVYGGALSQCALGNNLCSLLFHEEHESVQRLFDVGLFGLLGYDVRRRRCGYARHSAIRRILHFYVLLTLWTTVHG